MHCTRNVTEDLIWVGGSDRRLALFESVYPIPTGISYNAYLLKDETTVLFDTVDKAVSAVFFENLAYALEGRKLDYVVVTHMEPDHCATIAELVIHYPDVKIIGNAKTVTMLKQFFTFEVDSRVWVVKENDYLNSGKHVFKFIMAPMIHWPEVMMVYDETDKILFSADAFGSFDAINGHLFNDEIDYKHHYMDEARRYYCNIVGKYGKMVQNLFKKIEGFEIKMICPLHGVIWRTDIAYFCEKYDKWSTYMPEEKGVLIAYSSIYGDTENAANILANELSKRGVKGMAMYDVSVTHPSYVVADAFRFSHIVFATTTYNSGIFVNMETLLHDIVAHGLGNRTIAVIENGTWAATAGKQIKEMLCKLDNMTIIGDMVSLKSSVKEEQRVGLVQMADKIMESLEG